MRENVEDGLFEKLLYYFLCLWQGEEWQDSCNELSYETSIFIELIYFQEYQLIRSSSLMDSDAIFIILKRTRIELVYVMRCVFMRNASRSESVKVFRKGNKIK